MRNTWAIDVAALVRNRLSGEFSSSAPKTAVTPGQAFPIEFAETDQREKATSQVTAASTTLRRIVLRSAGGHSFQIFCRARTSGGGGEGWNHTAHRHCDGGPLDRGYAAVVPASLSLCDVVQRRPVRSPTRSHKGSQEIGASVRLMSPALSESGPLAGAPMTARPGRSLSASVSGQFFLPGCPNMKRLDLSGSGTFVNDSGAASWHHDWGGWLRFLGTCRDQRGAKRSNAPSQRMPFTLDRGASTSSLLWELELSGLGNSAVPDYDRS
ncbi:hypothetical protein CMUS01_00459 [Colletotrichum musicola]|uniref:Uncharacterized protein n=1 Tax=Colletotrichum musicola TaxID=2175873 RepID=A0A8H6U9S2_9PEZI|nr:hypothetical protein CMUS01_00459 [Colletotrichum musicola]